ncbi:MAG: methyltransferase [bacterium]|nr:methyltransferase [bacterium]
MLKRLNLGKLVLVYDDAVVYEPAEDSFLVLDYADVPACKKLLDLGCGTGILGLWFADRAKEVLLVDINPYAVLFSAINAEINGIRHARTAISCLLEDIEDEWFDVCLFNPPYLLEEECEDVLDVAWCSYKTVRAFFKQARKRIGTAYLVLNNYSYELLKEEIPAHQILATRQLPGERLLLLKVYFNRNRIERRNHNPAQVFE